MSFTNNSMIFLVTLAIMIATAGAFFPYQKLIPNGDKVPSPCGGQWAGVGHLMPSGGGVRNPFGDAFEAEGHVWTTALCKADSDRDGMTNGAELGDPHCHWTPTNNAHLRTASSHPGICEPVGSSKCSWQQYKC